MKSAQLLESLQAQVATLGARIAPLAQHQALSARFDRQLFSSQSTRMQDYLAEVQTNLARLLQYVAQGKTSQVAWLALRLAEQTEALQRESASWPLRYHDSAHLPAARLHASLLKHQDYERRLLEMIASREARLQQVSLLAEQQQLQREQETLQGRLARCRAALAKIERALARITR